MKHSEAAQFFRFTVVGLLGAAVYLFGSPRLQQYAQLELSTAASILFVAVVAMNYILHYTWTFRSDRKHSSTIPRFLGTAAGAMAINHATVLLCQRWFPLSQMVALFFGVALVITWNYLMSRLWVFVDRGGGHA